MTTVTSSTKERREAAKKFAKYLNSLSISQHARIVSEISEKCFVPRATIYAWKRCCCGIPKIYRPVIEEIARVRIF